MLSEGDTFGESALLEFNNVRQMSIQAVSEVKRILKRAFLISKGCLLGTWKRYFNLNSG